MSQMEDQKKLPVTLISGFLGAGKTTLLTNLLTSKTHSLRIGIIVNDIGQINIDGALLSSSQATLSKCNDDQKKKKKELQKVVEMQNGCICCTLRPELVSEVARMAKEGKIDYLVIESSGVSEPMQVAETFAPEFTDMMKDAAVQLSEEETSSTLTVSEKAAQESLASILAEGGLPTISRLDTCVTVVDAVSIFNDFNTADFLVDRHGREEVPEEDDRNISDLMVDQLEFADVIVLNKLDLISPSELPRLLSLIKTLNPGANIIQASHARVDPREVLNTGRFSYAKAAMSAGWLRSLQEEVLPETEEYGIGTFVYRQRRPFHPRRLWELIKEVFVVIQEEYIDDGEEEEEEEGEEGTHDKDHPNDSDSDNDTDMSVSPNLAVTSSTSSLGRTDSGIDVDSDGNLEGDKPTTADSVKAEESQPQLNPQARLASKKASPIWSSLLRSKGFFWLATRPAQFGEWSQAGVMLTLTQGGRWHCTILKEQWSDDLQVIQAIQADFDGEWGDRRQELVFIGTEMAKGRKEKLTQALDTCLLTDEEMIPFERIMRGRSKLRGNGRNKRVKRERGPSTLEEKQEALCEIFEDGFEDWPDQDQDQVEEGHEGHNHPPGKHK